MRRSLVLITLVIVLAAGLTGCLSGAPDGGDTDGGGDTGPMNDTENGNETDGVDASYEQEPHMGCQPGEINKNGTCTVAFSGANAEIFGAQNLTPITTSNTSFGGTPGYLARPADDGEYPAVVMIHEWWGLNDNIRAMARRFADNGFVALAVDLYEGRTASRPDKARALMQAAMERPARLRRNLEQAYYYLDIMPSTERIGSVGWCFGGGWSLRTALMFPEELDAGVIYYGELVTDRERLQPLQVPILGIFGGADPVVPPDRARAFEQVLTELGKTHRIHIYEGAEHAFANPSGESYDPEAAASAWARTMAFLRTHLAGETRSGE